MTDFFENFPLITDQYTNKKLRNIMLSVKIPESILNNNTLFYPYIVKEGETPTVVAFNYYGDMSYTFLIAIANNITDFMSQWVKSQPDFDAYIVEKYGSQAIAQSTIAYYKHNTDATYPLVTPISYAAFAASKQALFSSVSAYQDEWNTNEGKRTIQLIDRNIAPNLMFELDSILNS